MDIYLTALDGSGERLVFPMMPQEIRVKTGALFQSYTILKLGTVKLPLARDLTGFTWEGILPGEIRKKAPYVNNWRDPKELQTLWSIYERDGTKLRLMVTETPINHDVYIESYDVQYKHGMGDYYYTMNLIHAMDIKIKTVGESADKASNGGDKSTTTSGANDGNRPNPTPANTHTVTKGESLWSIAQIVLGNGSRYTEIYEANKALLDAANKDGNKYMIHPGQTLNIPNPVSTAPPKPKTKAKANNTTPPKTTPKADPPEAKVPKPTKDNQYWKEK